MRSFNITSLDDRTILRIFTFLPTFSSLAATVRSNKSFNAVYKANINLVLAAVAFNEIGPALPHALRVVRYRIPGPNSTSDIDEREQAEDEEEEEQTTFVTQKEARQLVENARIVTELEDLFSFGYKNQKSKKSQLTKVEAWRFRKAMYRIMLYVRIFPTKPVAYTLTSEDAIDQDEVRTEQLARKKFLSGCFTNELLQLKVVSGFLKNTINWVDRADGADMSMFGDFGDLSISLGPAVILDCYKNLGLEPLIDAIDDLTQADRTDYLNDIRSRPLLSGYIEDAINQIYEDRHGEPPARGHWAENLNTMLDRTENQDHHCEKCDKGGVIQLWGETTWDYNSLTSPVLGTHLFVDRLKGQLPRNPVDSQHAERALLNTPFKDIYHAIFRDGLKLSAYENWKEENWVCTWCLMQFMTDHLHLWVTHWRKVAGEKVADNCWYGYDCRTQTHKLSHAQNLNHLCEPKPRR